MKLISGHLILSTLIGIHDFISCQSLTAGIESICDMERNIAEIEESDSQRAVDGKRNPNISDQSVSCSHTSLTPPEGRPFWYVDLGDVYRIHHIRILNMGDCCEERFHDVQVTVAGPDEEYDVSCGYFKGPGKAAEIVKFQCPSNTRGRYVKVQIMKGERNVFTLCEVEVMGPEW